MEKLFLKKIFVILIFNLSCSAIKPNMKLFCFVNSPISSIISSVIMPAALVKKNINPDFPKHNFNLVQRTCFMLDQTFQYAKFLPQYKYISRPVYRYMGGRDNFYISIPAAFAVTDIIMHRVAPTSLLLINKTHRNEFKLSPTMWLRENLFHRGHLYGVAGWTALGLTVVYNRHVQNSLN